MIRFLTLFVWSVVVFVFGGQVEVDAAREEENS